MPTPTRDLEEQLRRSVFQAQQRKRTDLDEWLDAAPVPAPPKRLKGKKMTEQAITRHQEPANELTTWRAMREQANELVKSGFLPKAVNTPEKAMAIIQTGKELGLGPMQSLRSIHIIEGKPTMSADLIAGLALQRVPGSTLRVVESTDVKCVIEAARPGQPLTTFTWTIQDAQKAGLVGKDNWRKYPRAMLRARCMTETARAVMPDAVVGLYDPDELGAVTSPTGEVIQVIDNGSNGSFSPHLAPGEDPNAAGDEDTYRALCGRLATVEADLDTCDSYDKVNALRAILGTKARQSELTRTMQLKAESGDISPTQRQEIGKSWQRCNRKCEKLEKELAPPLEATFTEAEREPGADESEEF